jgi:hypothetical protein
MSLLLVLGTDRARAEGVAAKEAIDFDRDIRPVLADKCFKCHGPDADQRESGLRLDVRDEALRPADSGKAAIVPGKPDESPLVKRTASTKRSFMMPPPDSNKTLSDQQKDLLRAWVAQGAVYQKHWSFVPPKRPAPPTVKDDAWPRNAIDRFILGRLEAQGLPHAPEAGRTTLVRRVTLDLTGLPPTPAEVDAFLADTHKEAYERLVERLLASPRFGERMALEWLDAARYADTHGFHIDSGRDMTRWRAWVIDAFNANLPFDRFAVEQLAGDLLPNPTVSQKIASGFNRNHMINFEGGAIPEEYLTAYIVDRVNTTGTVFLGLTVACAQCHDHKFDPITQKDFYRFFAFFNNVPEQGLDGSKGNAAPVLRLPTTAQQAELGRLNTAIAEAEAQLGGPRPVVDAAQAEWEKSAPTGPVPPNIKAVLAVAPEKRNDGQMAELRTYYRVHFAPEFKLQADELEGLRKTRAELENKVPTTMVMAERPQPRETFMLVRGQYDKKGEQVLAGVPGFLSPLPSGAPANRLGLARWLVDRGHPLTARVAVNRSWQMLFGTGLVKTSEDFGTQGELPSHPDLLDWLAVEFMDPTAPGAQHAWDIKSIVRLVVTSATYRQSSAVTREVLAKDPENRLLARGARFRLPAELVRDQALAIGGLLRESIGGRSVSPYQPPGLWEELMSREDGANWTAQKYVQDHGDDLYRRTMYTFWKRTSPPPSLATFDAPDRETCTVRRARTNTPLQALVLMNDPTYVEAARKLAERILLEARSTEDRIALAFRLATARRPSDTELGVLGELYHAQLERYRTDTPAALRLLSVGESPRDPTLDPAEYAAWTMVGSAVLNLDETVTKG